jgi:hypothetical protein
LFGKYVENCASIWLIDMIFCVSKISFFLKKYRTKTMAEREWMYNGWSRTQAPSNDWIENTN